MSNIEKAIELLDRDAQWAKLSDHEKYCKAYDSAYIDWVVVLMDKARELLKEAQ